MRMAGAGFEKLIENRAVFRKIGLDRFGWFTEKWST
jgi:hypothetical protein